MTKPRTSVEEAADEALMAATFARLVSRYGHDRASLIMDGKDPAAQADLAAWRRLGQGRGQ